MGLTKPRAAQIFNLDYKQSTRVVATTDINLSGGAPNLVDGVTLSLGDRVLVTGQTTGSQNGLYYVTTLGSGSTGTWARTSDGNENGEIEAGMIVMVTEGTIYADTQWKLITDDPITINTTALTFTQNYMANSISSGTSNVVVNSNANVTISSAGTSNVINVGNTAVTFTGNLFPSANVTYSLGNTALRWKDLWLANSTLYIGDVSIATTGSALTINGANVLTGNAGSAFSTSGNITGGNVLTSGVVSATGNITGSYFIGNGSQLTGITSGGGGTPGGANTQIQFNDGGVFGGSAGLTFNKTTNAVSTTGTLSATGNITGGNLSGTNIVGTLTTASQTNITSVGTLSALSVTANLQGGNILTGGIVSATGNVTGNYFIGNGAALTGITSSGGITWTTVANTAPANASPGDFWYNSFNNVKYQYINDGDSNQWVDQSYPTSFSTLAVTGNITSGNLSVSTGTVTLGNIVNANGNGVGNIGSAGSYFNTVFAKATSAQYADLAEYYLSDAEYVPGTVVEFGGEFEITQSTQSHSTTVAGVISTNPSYLMNSGLQGKHVLAVALTGRVPCWVTGVVNKGDRLVTSKINGVATVLNNQLYEPGCIIGKALENYNSDTVGIIEIAVGRY
jgi:hypothetical protein